MERVTGIGGVFFKTRDPRALLEWYREHLGVEAEPGGEAVVFVALLDPMLAQLGESGVEVDERMEESDFGRFGWATDPEGNRFELWETPPGH